MVNFGLLAAEIVSLVWGTPANFNWFRVLAALLHGTLVVGVSQTAAFNRGRHLYSAGRPSGWALAHILVHCLYYVPLSERPALFKKLFDIVVADGGLVFIIISPCNILENPTPYRRFVADDIDGVQVRDMMTSVGFRECYQLSEELISDSRRRTE